MALASAQDIGQLQGFITMKVSDVYTTVPEEVRSSQEQASPSSKESSDIDADGLPTCVPVQGARAKPNGRRCSPSPSRAPSRSRSRDGERESEAAEPLFHLEGRSPTPPGQRKLSEWGRTLRPNRSEPPVPGGAYGG